MSAGDIFVTDADKRIRELEATIAHQIAGALAKQGDHIIEQERAIVGRDKRIAELEAKIRRREAALDSFDAVERARQAESAKLKEVLQEIADSGQGDLYSMKIAKAALEGKQE